MTAATVPAEVNRTILARLRQGGETHLAIAADMGVGRATVDRIAREHGYTRRRKLDPLPMAPRRLKEETAWQDRAACRGVLGFTELACVEQIPWCKKCPVRDDCLGFGLRYSVGWTRVDKGPVWGGETPRAVTRLQKLKAKNDSRKREAA